MKKIIGGLLAVIILAVVAIYVKYKLLGPGEESVAWVQNLAIDPATFQVTNPGAKLEVLSTPQGWKPETHESFWHKDQGSLLAPYDIFISLNVANGDERFISAHNMARLRYISTAPSSDNPDVLPIGFAKTEKKWKGEIYAGMTCAACHSGMITYQGKAMFIDGAPTQADFQTMTVELSKALTFAYENQEAFDALADRMDIGGSVAKQELRQRVEKAALAMAERVELNRTSSRYGFGRVDAVGQIYNSVAAVNLGIPQNRSEPSAPVSYPFIWGTGQSDVVQWTGFAPNYVPGGILIRNAGEVLGVFGGIDVPKDGEKKWLKKGFKSSINIANLGTIEDWVNKLEPPAWPTGILGPIDIKLAAAGQVLYETHCQECHQIVTPYQTYVSHLSQVSEIKTDPKAEQKTLETAINQQGEEQAKLDILVQQTVGAIVNQPLKSIKATFDGGIIDKFGEKGTTTYKGRPLNGIWATAPYLHNGSVPTLDDLLKSSEDRPKTFTLGSWEYDPVKVGHAPFSGADAFTFDTRLPGNSNAGHDYGEEGFTDNERKALVEFLKTL